MFYIIIIQLALVQGTLRIPGPTSPLSSRLLTSTTSKAAEAKGGSTTETTATTFTTPIKSKFASLFPTSSASRRSGNRGGPPSSQPQPKQPEPLGPNYFEVKVQSIGLRQDICIGLTGESIRARVLFLSAISQAFIYVYICH